MPPYKIHVQKSIWLNEERTELFDHLYRDIELPFLPFIGLAIQGLYGWYCDPIETLSWNAEGQFFIAEVRAEAGDDDRSAEDIRHWDMKYAGWLSHKKKTAE